MAQCNDDFIEAVERGDLATAKAALAAGQSADTVDQKSGIPALHIAVGLNDLPMAQLLVESNASFRGDSQGRWPTTIAAMCKVDQDLSDYILEAEAASVERQEATKNSGPRLG